jgi:hypothetical protein
MNLETLSTITISNADTIKVRDLYAPSKEASKIQKQVETVPGFHPMVGEMIGVCDDLKINVDVTEISYVFSQWMRAHNSSLPGLINGEAECLTIIEPSMDYWRLVDRLDTIIYMACLRFICSLSISNLALMRARLSQQDREKFSLYFSLYLKPPCVPHLSAVGWFYDNFELVSINLKYKFVSTIVRRIIASCTASPNNMSPHELNVVGFPSLMVLLERNGVCPIQNVDMERIFSRDTNSLLKQNVNQMFGFSRAGEMADQMQTTLREVADAASTTTKIASRVEDRLYATVNQVTAEMAEVKASTVKVADSVVQSTESVTQNANNLMNTMRDTVGSWKMPSLEGVKDTALAAGKGMWETVMWLMNKLWEFAPIIYPFIVAGLAYLYKTTGEWYYKWMLGVLALGGVAAVGFKAVAAMGSFFVMPDFSEADFEHVVNQVQGANDDLEAWLEPILLSYSIIGIRGDRKSFTAMVKDFPGLQKGASALSKAIFSSVIKISSWVSKYTSLVPDLALSLDNELTEWINRCDAYYVDDQTIKLDVSTVGIAELIALIEDGEELALFFQKSGKGAYTTILQDHLRKLSKIRTEMLAQGASAAKSRIVPVDVCLFGEPGTGKSELATYLCKCWCLWRFRNKTEKLRKFRENPERFIHQRTTEQWFEGITGETEAIWRDDIGCTDAKTPSESQWVELIQEVNGTSVAIAMAEAQSKGKHHYHQTLSIQTTNATYLDDDNVKYKSAVARRLHICVKVGNKGDVPASEMKLDKRSMDIYELELGVMSKKDYYFHTLGIFLTIPELFAMMVGRFRMHEEYFANNADEPEEHFYNMIDAALLMEKNSRRTDDDVLLDVIDKEIAAELETVTDGGCDNIVAHPELFFDEVPEQSDIIDALPPGGPLLLPNVNQMESGSWKGKAKEELLEVAYSFTPPPPPPPKPTLFDTLFGAKPLKEEDPVIEMLRAEAFPLSHKERVLNPYGYVDAESRQGVVEGILTRQALEVDVHGGMMSNIKADPNKWSHRYGMCLAANGRASFDDYRLSITSYWRPFVETGVALLWPGQMYSPTSDAWWTKIPLPIPFLDVGLEFEWDREWRAQIDKSKAKLPSRCDTDQEYIAVYKRWIKGRFSVAEMHLSLIYLVGVPVASAVEMSISTACCAPEFARRAYRALRDPEQRRRLFTKKYVMDTTRTAFRKGCEALMVNLINPLWSLAKRALSFVAQYMVEFSLAIGLFYSLWTMYYKSNFFNSVNQGYEPSTPQGARSRARQQTRVNRQFSRGQKNQMVGGAVFDEVAPMLRKNIWELVDEKDARLGSLLCVGGRTFVFVRHFYVRLRQAYKEVGRDPKFIIQRGDIKVDVPYSQMDIIEDWGINKDLMKAKFNVNIPEGKNITSHFATQKEASFAFNERLLNVGLVSKSWMAVVSGEPGERTFRVEDDVIVPKITNVTDSVTVMDEVEGRVTRTEVISYLLPTRNGACGLPLISGDKIVGMHICGNGFWGHSARLDVSMISEAIDRANREEEFEMDLEVDFDSEADYTTALTLNQGYDMECHTGVPISVLAVPSSMYCKNSYVPYKSSQEYVERKLAPVHTGRELYPVARSGYSEAYQQSYDPELLRTATIAVGDHMKSIQYNGSFNPFDLESAIDGIPGTGFSSMDLTTSPGYHESALGQRKSIFISKDASGRKIYGEKWPEFVQSLAMNVDKMAMGIVPFYPFVDNHKSELRKLSKIDKPRLISACNFESNVVGRMYYGPFSRWCVETVVQNEFLIGFNPVKHYDELERKFVGFGGSDRYGAGDFSEWDKRIFPELIYAAGDAVEILFGEAGAGGSTKGRRWATIRRSFLETCAHSYHVRGAYLEQWTSSWPSGNALTAPFNSLINAIKFQYAFLRLAANFLNNGITERKLLLPLAIKAYRQNVICRFLGDDNRFAVKKGYEWFNVNSLQDIFKEFGDVYTDDNKTTGELRALVPQAEASILKRMPVYHEDIDIWVGALRLDVILEMPLWTTRGRELENSIERADNALRELALHPREVWNEWFPRIRKFVEPQWSPPISDYETARSNALIFDWNIDNQNDDVGPSN